MQIHILHGLCFPVSMREGNMSYCNASDILPAELIEEIQKYVDGQYLYIPRRHEARRSWGDNTQTRAEVADRNRRIRREHAEGASCRALAQRYFLAEKTIEAIVRRRAEERECES